jgi:hypothetical protein
MLTIADVRSSHESHQRTGYIHLRCGTALTSERRRPSPSSLFWRDAALTCFAIVPINHSQKIYYSNVIRHPKDTFNPNIFIASDAENSTLIFRIALQLLIIFIVCFREQREIFGTE